MTAEKKKEKKVMEEKRPSLPEVVTVRKRPRTPGVTLNSLMEMFVFACPLCNHTEHLGGEAVHSAENGEVPEFPLAFQGEISSDSRKSHISTLRNTTELPHNSCKSEILQSSTFRDMEIMNLGCILQLGGICQIATVYQPPIKELGNLQCRFTGSLENPILQPVQVMFNLSIMDSDQLSIRC